jgi:alpha-L-fucosidase 2
VLLKPGGAVRFQSPWANLSTSVKVPAGQFIDLVVTISEDGYITVYVNGTDEGSAEIGPLSLGACMPTWLQFGALPGGGDPLTGAVGEMEIWPRALSASEVAGLSLS